MFLHRKVTIKKVFLLVMWLLQINFPLVVELSKNFSELHVYFNCLRNTDGVSFISPKLTEDWSNLSLETFNMATLRYKNIKAPFTVGHKGHKTFFTLP